jgi:tetratricopeptide (TPR) repeat protein
MQGKSIGERTIYFESLEPFYRMDWAPLRGFIRGKEKFVDSPIPELYDLDSDFKENKNLMDPQKLPLFRQQLDQFMQTQISDAEASASQKTDPSTLRKLRSLGYVTSSPANRKKTYGSEDDIKSLLPLHNRIIAAYRMRESGKIKEGIAALENIIKQENRLDIAYAYLVKLYKENNQIDAVLERLREGCAVYPFSYEILELYCENLMELQNYDEIIRVLSRGQPFQMEQDPELWNILGLAYVRKGRGDEALEAFEKSASIDPEYADTFSNLGAIYLSLYMQSHEKEFFSKTVENLNKVIFLDLKNVAAYNSLGAAYMTAGALPDAIRNWENVIEIDPRAGKTYYYLGLAYLSQGDMIKARLFLITQKHQFYHLFTRLERERYDIILERVK